MSTPIDFYFLPLFFIKNNVIFTSYTIKNLIDPGNSDHPTQLVTRDMTVVDAWTGF
jgi:hypothetical protein